MRKLETLMVAVLCGWGAASAQAADPKAGAALHQANCVSCHDAGVYTRADRRVTTLEGLQKQVRRCELSLGLTWHDDEVDNVVQYLNDGYYRFQ